MERPALAQHAQHAALLMCGALEILNFYWLFMILNGLQRVVRKGMGETTYGSRDAPASPSKEAANKKE